MIQQVVSTFETSIEGSGTGFVNTQELSGGAKINRIFHERLRFSIVKIVNDEKEMRREIAIAIQNILAIRGQGFTPGLAFDTIAKKQILQLRDPILACVDLVIRELLYVVNNCCECVNIILLFIIKYHFNKLNYSRCHVFHVCEKKLIEY